MISKKTKEEWATLTKGGAILARILKELSAASKPGVSTEVLDTLARSLTKKYDVEPVLLGYKPSFSARPYPAAICTSVNNVVQHGIPSPNTILKAGDIINLDMSIGYKHLIVDSGITVPVGEVDKKATMLMRVTKEALYAGIDKARAGNHVGDIGYAISQSVKPSGFSVVEALCGHGVGYRVHEEPMVPNVAKKGTGPEIEVGMVFAIEPIVNEGSKEVVFDDDGDGYTVTSKDGSRSAHFEHTVIVTEGGPLIATE